MDKVKDFNLEKARKHALNARDNLEATGRDMGADMLRMGKNLVDSLDYMDYSEGKKYAPALLECYLSMATLFANYCIEWYEMDEPVISQKLWEITDILQARMK